MQINAVSGFSNAPMSNHQDVDGDGNPYPDRPGMADCMYYMRTGVCGYGSSCRYNHPATNWQVNFDIDEFPERIGQPDCQYFLKTGTCKFGAACKYHHPRDRLDARPVALNIMGLPLRQDEKSCPYYMRNGTCKFGIACKFNHPQPQPATIHAVFPANGAPSYGSSDSSMVPPSSVPLMGGLSTWPLARTSYVSTPHLHGLPAYMPVILPSSQGTMPVQQGWSTYMGSAGHHLPSTDVLGPTESSGTVATLPERPDQPDCQYYMKTGSCKYGTSCKYHHPKGNPTGSLALGPFGLPLRPGRAVCTFYSMFGSCRYGSACKFDHPFVGYYNYPVPAFPAPDPSVLFPPNPRSPQLHDGRAKSDERSKSELHESQNDNERDGNAPQPLETSLSSNISPSLDSSKLPL